MLGHSNLVTKDITGNQIKIVPKSGIDRMQNSAPRKGLHSFRMAHSVLDPLLPKDFLKISTKNLRSPLPSPIFVQYQFSALLDRDQVVRIRRPFPLREAEKCFDGAERQSQANQ